MKKLAAVILTFLMVLSAGVPMAFAEGDTLPERVEIRFRVGDSTLGINGKMVKVETPYVVGDGTTLVPLRVMTEAFGAKVLWDEKTETVTLTYPDIEIKIQIGNKMADVNGHTEKMLEAPELTGESTMVPLRFLSTAFGAEVSYDAATEEILVVKEAKGEQGSKITGTTDLERIGDSYYKWSMDTPKELFMEERNFDGSRTFFTDDNENVIFLQISINNSEISFDAGFEKEKNNLASLTLMQAEKKKDASGNQFMHFQAKDKESFLDRRVYLKDKYVYQVSAVISQEDLDAKKQSFLDVMDTFALSFGDKALTYDLSNVENGYRHFNDKTYQFSIDVPEDWWEIGDSSKENEFDFAAPTEDSYVSSYISAGIYSKQSVGSAQELAQKDLEHNKEFLNPELAEISEISEKQIGGINGFFYTSTVSGTKKKSIMTDTFFEVGDYVYNVSVRLSKDEKDQEKITEHILASIKAEKLDSNKIGQVLRFDADYETTTQVEIDGGKVEIPTAWQKVAEGTNNCVYLDRNYGVEINMLYQQVETGFSTTQFMNVMNQIVDNQRNNGWKITKSLERTQINSKTFYRFTATKEEDGVVKYQDVYFVNVNNRIYDFAFYIPEEYFGGKINNIINQMLESLSAK